MEKNYLVELNIFKENAFHGLQKIPLDNFPRNFYIWSAIVSGACIQKIKIGRRANFRANINFNTDSADACILVMACVDCARACS